ncbi:5'-methylthioadenosine/S-adenosylhomocysteine nucleosidase [Microbacteriaceae bacterium VKM Ac-2855]|nr:5'-methylthioadenosine/S-adenosylhomocysteine nucleosidase [Microbacteriaceae bacterium VKM Ac-2855]
MSVAEVVVIVAMADEAAPFIALADSVGDPVDVGRAVHRRILVDGRAVLLVESGIGMVNAAGAATSAILASQQLPEAVISAGSAGGVGAGVRVGDVVVGTEYVNTDADARAFGYALGQSPGMPARYEADPALAAAADSPDLALHRGLLVSGDTFVDADRVDRVRDAYPGALATDMESLAIAQTSHVFGVPFVSVRGISDLCGPAGADDFLTHVDDAADRSAAVVRVVLGSLER